MTTKPPTPDDTSPTPTPITTRQTGSAPMAEAKRVFLRDYAVRARELARAEPIRAFVLGDYAARCETLALRFDRWTGPVLHEGLVLSARFDDADRAKDLAEYAAVIAEASRLRVRV